MTGHLSCGDKLPKGIPKTKYERRIITKRNKRPEKYFTQNSFAAVTGWLKRKDFVFFINSFVNGITPSNKEKRIGKMKQLIYILMVIISSMSIR
jgi:hypothetical protein